MIINMEIKSKQLLLVVIGQLKVIADTTPFPTKEAVNAAKEAMIEMNKHRNLMSKECKRVDLWIDHPDKKKIEVYNYNITDWSIKGCDFIVFPQLLGKLKELGIIIEFYPRNVENGFPNPKFHIVLPKNFDVVCDIFNQKIFNDYSAEELRLFLSVVKVIKRKICKYSPYIFYIPYINFPDDIPRGKIDEIIDVLRHDFQIIYHNSTIGGMVNEQQVELRLYEDQVRILTLLYDSLNEAIMTISKKKIKADNTDSSKHKGLSYNPETGFGTFSETEFKLKQGSEYKNLFDVAYKNKGKMVNKDTVVRILEIDNKKKGADIAKVFETLGDRKSRKTDSRDVAITLKINDVVKTIRSKTGLKKKQFVQNSGTVTLDV
jgi:hypothetical protein